MTATATRVGVDASIISAEYWLGSYFWYSIPKSSIPLSKARRAFKDSGLDPDMLPKERRGEHRMMEACASVEGVRSNGHREEIHADQVVRDDNFLIYQITRHVWHKDERVIEHPKALRVIYDLDKETLHFETLDGTARSEVAHLEDEIKAHFDKNAGKLTGHNFRTILRHYVEAAGAENCRGQSGGVYFLPQNVKLSDAQDARGNYYNKLRAFHGPSLKGDAFIASIKQALTIIYGRAPEWHRIPTIDDEEQREFLKRKMLENFGEELKGYRDECLEMVSSHDQRLRGLRTDKRASMVQRRAEIDAKRQQYAALLGDALSELDRDMSLADKALGKFLKVADA